MTQSVASKACRTILCGSLASVAVLLIDSVQDDVLLICLHGGDADLSFRAAADHNHYTRLWDVRCGTGLELCWIVCVICQWYFNRQLMCFCCDWYSRSSAVIVCCGTILQTTALYCVRNLVMWCMACMRVQGSIHNSNKHHHVTMIVHACITVLRCTEVWMNNSRGLLDSSDSTVCSRAEVMQCYGRVLLLRLADSRTGWRLLLLQLLFVLQLMYCCIMYAVHH